MIGESRISTKSLALLCRRMSVSLGAGVDVRNIFTREANSAHGSARRRFAQIRDDVARGNSVSEAIDNTDQYFPEFFREMVKVGEETGQLPEVFRQLAEHYEHQLQLRRIFLAAISWPLIELAIALTVVGGIIFAMGAIPALARSGIDMLGFGLKGTSGLVTYLAFLATLGVIGFLIYRATVYGKLWAAPIQRTLMAIPKLGTALETMAMARLCWAMHITLNTGMDLRKAMRLSIRSTQNVLYTQHIDGVLRMIRSGHEIHEALDATGVFPRLMIDATHVGEESGQLPESMGHLSLQYQQQSKAAMAVITALLGFAVMLLVGVVIIYLIFQIFQNAYLGPINDALNPNAR
jgi:type IV pilus assembly protein PilC